MAKTTMPPTTPMWPWGGPGRVRERLVAPIQIDRKQDRKAGNPKKPALASSALLDFIGPGHTSEELRMPLPQPPPGHDADVETFFDRPYLQSAARRGDDEAQEAIERNLASLSVPRDRLDRMKALLAREEQMLTLVGEVGAEMREILRLMWDAQKDEGY